MPPGPLDILVSALAGLAAGWFFFAGLWWTVQRLPSSRQPALLALASFWVRAAVVASTLALLARGGRYDRLLIALAAILVVRTLILRSKRPRNAAHEPVPIPVKGDAAEWK